MKKGEENMEHQILEAAETLFLEQGYAKTTTVQIAKVAGCNQALVHYYYRTKDNLFDKVFEEKFRLMASNLMTVDLTETSLEDKIVKMIGLHFDFLKQNPRLPLFILNEITSNPDRHRSLLDKLIQYPMAIIDQFEADLKVEIEKGAVRPISGIDIVATIVSLNVTPFLVSPLLQKVSDLPQQDLHETLEHRKKETIDTVLARLRK